jgi:quinol monooxygenase YgiN
MTDPTPVTEHAIMRIDPAQQRAFEAALPGAITHLTGTPGCRSVRVSRRVEAPGAYLLIVEWDSLDDHLVGFRESPAFPAWRAVMTPFWLELPTVEHFTTVAQSPVG